MPIEQVHAALQHNLCQMPLETYVYDGIDGKKLERLFDNTDFYNEVDVGITYGKFDFIKDLHAFVPVTTYDLSNFGVMKRDSEFVSSIEGTVQPYFGFLNRLDKIQFGFHAADGEGQAKVDHSKHAIEHAQHIANLFVDEARLSDNFFEWTNHETANLLSNHDVHVVKLPTPHEHIEAKELNDFYRTEIYFF